MYMAEFETGGIDAERPDGREIGGGIPRERAGFGAVCEGG